MDRRKMNTLLHSRAHNLRRVSITPTPCRRKRDKAKTALEILKEL